MSDGFSMKVDEGDLRKLIGKLDRLSDLDTTKALMAGGLVVEAAGKENIIYYDFIDTGATLNHTFQDGVPPTGDALNANFLQLLHYAQELSDQL